MKAVFILALVLMTSVSAFASRPESLSMDLTTNPATLAQVEGKLGRRLSSDERQLIFKSEQVLRQGSQVADATGRTSGGESIMFVCVGGNVSVVGHYAFLECYDFKTGRAAILHGTDWVSLGATINLATVVVSGPNVSSPTSYRGTYVNPKGVGLSYYVGLNAVKYTAKQKIPTTEMFTQKSPVDEDYSLMILGLDAGFIVNFDYSGSIFVD